MNDSIVPTCRTKNVGKVTEAPITKELKMQIILLTIIIILALSLTACSSDSAAITGVVTYHQRIALPDDAVVTVKIQDVSLMDVAAKVIGEQVIKTDGAQVPIPYEVPYNPNAIDERHTYSMSARIEDSTGKLLFISDTTNPVITHDNPSDDVEIVVVPVGASQ